MGKNGPKKDDTVGSIRGNREYVSVELLHYKGPAKPLSYSTMPIKWRCTECKKEGSHWQTGPFAAANAVLDWYEHAQNEHGAW